MLNGEAGRVQREGCWGLVPVQVRRRVDPHQRRRTRGRPGEVAVIGRVGPAQQPPCLRELNLRTVLPRSRRSRPICRDRPGPVRTRAREPRPAHRSMTRAMTEHHRARLGESNRHPPPRLAPAPRTGRSVARAAGPSPRLSEGPAVESRAARPGGSWVTPCRAGGTRSGWCRGSGGTVARSTGGRRSRPAARSK